MKNVAIDIRALLEKDWGGVSWYTYYLTDGLIRQAPQNNLRIFLFYNEYSLLNCSIAQLLKKWSFYKNVKIKGYKIPNKILNLSMRFLNYPYIDNLLTIEQSSNRTIERIDYFILPNLSFVSLSKKVKRIAVCHDLSFDVFPEFFTLRQRLWHKTINPREFYKQAGQIIAVSPNTKQDLIDLYDIPAGRITVIYPGIDHHTFKIIDDCAAVQRKYKLPNDFILFVGTLEPRKNLETLIEAFDLLYDKQALTTNLIIAGPEGWKFDRIYRFWLKAKHKDRIHFVNKVDSADLPALYNLARIFIYPSFYEGFGFPLIEAMACGTPVIAGGGSSMPEVIGNAGLLVDPFDIADIAKAMERLLSNQGLCDKLRDRGLERAKKFDWDKSVKQVMHLLVN
jgi:glycosyltransferase involved in cell wall biosynthesis